MSFFGSSFIFDGTPSDIYNLYISTPDGGETDNTGSTNVTILKDVVFRRPVAYLLGVQQAPVLEFEVSFNSPGEISAQDAQVIQRWLFGKQTYKKLAILQNDLQDVYFNVILKNPKINRVGNIITGFKATAECDSPWGWQFSKTITKNYTESIINDTFNFMNISDNTDYMYPIVQFTMNTSGGTLSLTNVSDSSRQFSFTGLISDEIVTVKNDLGIITSSTGLLRMSNFNKKWFRFVPGKNTITVFGNISQLKITYQNARKIGG